MRLYQKKVQNMDNWPWMKCGGYTDMFGVLQPYPWNIVLTICTAYVHKHKTKLRDFIKFSSCQYSKYIILEVFVTICYRRIAKIDGHSWYYKKDAYLRQPFATVSVGLCLWLASSGDRTCVLAERAPTLSTISLRRFQMVYLITRELIDRYSSK